MVYIGVASYMCMQVYDSANKISTILMQCHPAAITQMVMDGLHSTGRRDAERAQPKAALACIAIIFYLYMMVGCRCSPASLGLRTTQSPTHRRQEGKTKVQ